MRARVTSFASALDDPAQRLLAAAEAAAREQEAPLWLVGGALRDVALDRAVNDLDLALDGDVARFARVCGAALRGDVEVHMQHRSRFGTASIRAAGMRIDVARLRTETYERPGALPRVRATPSVERDLARRDFTVNAIALGLTGEHRDAIVDPFDGLSDLSSRTLRVLHRRSFEDDATRLWRGARTATIADLIPDEGTARLIRDGARWLNTISGERLWAELALTAKRGRALRTLALLEGWGVLAGTHPALRLDHRTRAALRHRYRPLPPVRLAAVLIAPLDDPRAILERFAVNRELRETVLDTRRLLDAGDSLDDLARLEDVRPEARVAASWLSPGTEPQRLRELRRWERTRSPLTADDLRRLGVPRGPEIGRTLDRLRRARFLGRLSTPAEARALVRELQQGEAGNGREWETRDDR